MNRQCSFIKEALVEARQVRHREVINDGYEAKVVLASSHQREVS
jgi:hypothetical protein